YTDSYRSLNSATSLHFLLPLRLIMFTGLLSSLSSFTSLPPSVLLLILVVVVAWFLIIYPGTKPSSCPPPARGSIPCLPRLPVLGSLPWMRGHLPPHLLFSQLAQRYGSLFALYLGPQYTVVVNDHQHAKEVLLQRGKDFAGRPNMVTTNLLTRGGKDIAFADYSPLWKLQRRLTHNSFTLFGEGTSRLQDIGLCLCAELLSSGTRGFDPSLAVTRAVTNVVCMLVFSATYHQGDTELQEVVLYNQGILDTIARGALVDIYPWMKVHLNTYTAVFMYTFDLKSIMDIIRLLLKKYNEILILNQGQRASGSEDEGITDDHVLMTAAEAFSAGVETTSSTLLWILAYLLHHPEIQDRVQKELDEQIGSDRAVCAIRPVSPVLISHTAITDSSIGGHAISRGTQVLVNMWSIHHNPQYWDNPDLFNPDRFLDDQGQRVTPSCFLPFGAGPRVCVGESLARLELFLFLSSLLQRLSFSLPDGAPLPNLEGQLGVVLQPLPYKVVVTPRAGWQGGAN
uniref:Cytochrome P450, family 17, subfamily A, polypeptide 2 n=1 Tax=Monopterus albus TaxID=43700 RepID=A0A3Q3QD15_MONAL